MTFLMKIILAGDGSVGKTSLRKRYLGEGFKEIYDVTIGADFSIYKTLIAGRSIKFQMWDLAGQPRFKMVQKSYYLGSLGALLIFDITKRETFQSLQNWIHEIWNNNGRGLIPIVLLGNKVDLRDQYPESISNEVIQRYCAKLSEQSYSKGFEIKYLETSAKTGLNVAKAFELLANGYFEFVENQKKARTLLLKALT